MSYINPIYIALDYKESLKAQKVQNQAELAKSLNVTRSRVNQYLRLLKLPETLQEDVRSGRVKATERSLRNIMAIS
jgi:ParB-like chromosome segregation protein Spo0J